MMRIMHCSPCRAEVTVALLALLVLAAPAHAFQLIENVPLNPKPYVTSLEPGVVPPAKPGSDRLIVVKGSSFVDGSSVRVNGQPRQTFYRGSNELRFVLFGSDHTTVGTRQITVFNPEPGGGVSDAIALSIEYDVPRLQALDPNRVDGGTADGITLRLTGGGWATATRVVVDGRELTPYTFGGSYLHVRVPADQLAEPGRLPVYATNPAPGGGTSATLELEVLDPNPPNPVPVLSSVEPASVVRPALDAVILRARGTGFVPGSQLVWSGLARTTTYVSETELTAELPATTLEGTPFLGVRVRNPEPGGGDSNGKNVSVVNPSPQVTSIHPSWLELGTSGNRLRLTGTGFVRATNAAPASVVRWNGDERRTHYLGPTQLEVELRTDLDMISPGTARLTVFNGAPGGGTSAEVHVALREPPPPNPGPSVESIDPGTLVRPVASIVGIRVRGTGFVPGAEVLVSGAARPTQFLSEHELVADIPNGYFNYPPVTIGVRSPAPGGALSNTIELAVRNPVPAISSVEPSALEAGSGAASLRVTGTGFVNQTDFGAATAASWNGTARTTTVLSATELRVDLSAEDLAAPGTGRLALLNPAPGGGESAPVDIELRAGELNPAPSLESVDIDPSMTTPGLALILRGSGFVPASSVIWDGRELQTTFESDSRLSARVPPGLMAARRGSEFMVTVRNPSPGGGTSNGVQVTLPRQ